MSLLEAAMVHAVAEPANDNVPGAIVPDDDRPFFLALGLVCIGVVALAVYAAVGGTDDVMAMLRR